MPIGIIIGSTVVSLIMIALLCMCVVFGIRAFNPRGIDVIRNPYSSKGVLLWPAAIPGHSPTDTAFDFPIKQDLVRHALTLKRSHAIVDCGAHVGDGSVPMAAALANAGRADIMVYAIEPDPHKCAIIRLLTHLNNITNLKIICTGLSDKNGKYKESVIPSGNSGATQWTSTETGGFLFHTLDTLYEEGRIVEPLGCVHLDVEGMEMAAIRGARSVIQKFKPYVSVEDWSHSPDKFRDILPDYRFVQRIEGNNIYVPR